MKLFDRQVVLQIDDRSYSDLRVDFKVSKSISSEPNTAEVSVYNLSRDRTAMTKARNRDARIRVLAGYSVPRLIFEGNPTKGGIKIKTDGPDRILEIEAQDGLTRYQSARFNKSFATETRLETVVNEAAGELGLPAGKVKVPGDIRLTQGVALSGPVRDVLDRLADSVGADWSIQDGTFQFVPSDETNDRKATVFSSENGNLIGEPEATDDGLEIKGLLDGSINPGDRYTVDSEDFNGVYKAREVTLEGSKFSDKFYVTVKGTEA